MLYVTVLFGSWFLSRYLTFDLSVISLQIILCCMSFEQRLFISIFFARLSFPYVMVDMCDMCLSLYDCFSNFCFLQHVNASEGMRILGVHKMNVGLGEPKVETTSCLENKAAIVTIQLCLTCGNMEKWKRVYSVCKTFCLHLCEGQLAKTLQTTRNG